jgi:hypothetical protein
MLLIPVPEWPHGRDPGGLPIWGIVEGTVGSSLVSGCGTNVVARLLVASGQIEAHNFMAGAPSSVPCQLNKHLSNQSRDLGVPTDGGS